VTNAQSRTRTLVRHDHDLWSAEHHFRWMGGLVPIPVRMTVLRLADGDLILHSPIPITPTLRAELEALGRVAHLVAPWAHGKFVPDAAACFPEAQLVVGPKPPASCRSLRIHASLPDAPPAAWAGQIDVHLVRGFRLDEVLLFQRASRTLVMTDLCFHLQRSESRVARAFFRANDMWRRFGPSRALRIVAVSDRAALRGSLEEVLRWDFERIVPGHGDVIERGGPAALRAAWSHLA